MRALILRGPSSDDEPPLDIADMPVPSAANGEILVRVSVCAVCRTDLDIVQGRVVPPRYPLVPGHQVVGRVVATAGAGSFFTAGDRVGIAWIHAACGVCRWCRAGVENLCPFFQATGRDVNGGYAEYATVRATFAHHIPDELTDLEAAPLLCAGAIGWRSLRLAAPDDGEPLGLAGFGASGHLMLQLARHRHPSSPLYVFARDAGDRAFARELGAAWVGDFGDVPPNRMSAIIDTTPAWKPMVSTLRHLAPGGRFVINAIRKGQADRQELLELDYASDLWMEREVRSVANVTRHDVRDILDIAARTGIRPTVEELPLEQANEALAKMRRGGAIRGAMVLRVAPPHTPSS
jgi:propanol-preferring alcohol dehydrogenase